MTSLLPDDFSPLERMQKYGRHFTHRESLSTDAASIDDIPESERLERQKNWQQVNNDYYNLVSPSYEHGWGQKFHYCPQKPGHSIKQSLEAYEVMFAELIGLKKGMRVLDVGCGIGGPARTIAAKIGCEVVGININEWHIERGTALTKEDGLEGLVTLVLGDFMVSVVKTTLSRATDETVYADRTCRQKMPFGDASFDAVYSFEALCYAPVPIEAYNEVFRVLKPGGPFGFSEWTMTNKFNEQDAEHRAVRNWIEYGNGITRMPLTQEVRDGLKAVGFQVRHEENMAYRSTPGPWYFGPAGNVRWAIGWEDFWTVLSMSPVAVFYRKVLCWFMVLFGLAPREVLTQMDTMWYCCRGVAKGGRLDVFTPMFVFVGNKPSVLEGSSGKGPC